MNSRRSCLCSSLLSRRSGFDDSTCSKNRKRNCICSTVPPSRSPVDSESKCNERCELSFYFLFFKSRARFEDSAAVTSPRQRDNLTHQSRLTVYSLYTPPPLLAFMSLLLVSDYYSGLSAMTSPPSVQCIGSIK